MPLTTASNPAAVYHRPRLEGGVGTDPVDAYVGLQVRNMRKIKRISQSELAKAIGVTFQQVQKYETGSNRVSASKLYAIAAYLGHPVSRFFPLGEASISDNAAGQDRTPLSPAEALEITDLFARIPGGKMRNSMRALLQSVATEF